MQEWKKIMTMHEEFWDANPTTGTVQQTLYAPKVGNGHCEKEKDCLEHTTKKMKNTGILKLKNLEQKSDACQHDDNRIVTVFLWFVACKNFPVLWTVTLVTQRWNKCTFIKTFQIKQFSANGIVKPYLLSLTSFSKQWKHEKFH